MKEQKDRKCQTESSVVVDFLGKYNFQKVCYFLKNAEKKDSDILALSMLKKRGRPQIRVKKPKNRVIEQIREHHSIKQSLDTMLDHLLTSVVLRAKNQASETNLFKTSNALSEFKEAFLNAAISHSTTDTCKITTDHEEDFYQKAFIINFPTFNEIDSAIQLQVHHYVHFILEAKLINENLSFDCEVLADLQHRPTPCPYFALALFSIILSSLVSMREFRLYMFALLVLVKCCFRKFAALSECLSVNINVPKSLNLLTLTNKSDFRNFCADFFGFCEIYVKGQGFIDVVQEWADEWYSVGVKKVVEVNELQNVVRGWELACECIGEIFFQLDENN